MKKLFLSVAIIATMASCSKNEFIEDATLQQKQIGFSTLNDNVTRVPSDTDGLGYVVYAQYTTAAEGGITDWYVNALAVSSTNTVTDAIKVPYWPEPSLDFYAYAATATNISVVPTAPAAADTKGTLPGTYTVATASEDFTVATPVAQKYDGDNANVALTFEHMLSRVMVSASLADGMVASGYKLNLTDVTTELTVVKNQGKFDVTAIEPAITETTVKGTELTYTRSNPNATVTTSAKSAAEEFLIMPHVATEYCTVTIKGVKLIHDNHQPIAVTLTKTFDGAGQAFAQGTQYNLNFEISLTKITFTSKVTDWTTPATDVSIPKIK